MWCADVAGNEWARARWPSLRQTGDATVPGNARPVPGRASQVPDRWWRPGVADSWSSIGVPPFADLAGESSPGGRGLRPAATHRRIRDRPRRAYGDAAGADLPRSTSPAAVG